MPALFDLSQSHSIPAHFAIIAVDRVALSEDALRKRLHEGVKRFARSGKTARQGVEAALAAYPIFAGRFQS